MQTEQIWQYHIPSEQHQELNHDHPWEILPALWCQPGGKDPCFATWAQQVDLGSFVEMTHAKMLLVWFDQDLFMMCIVSCRTLVCKMFHNPNDRCWGLLDEHPPPTGRFSFVQALIFQFSYNLFVQTWKFPFRIHKSWPKYFFEERISNPCIVWNIGWFDRDWQRLPNSSWQLGSKTSDRQQTVIMVLMSIESYRTGKIWICKRLYGVVINRADGNRQKGSEMENGDQHVWIRIVQQLDRGSRKGGDRGVSRMADKTYISIIRKTVSKYNWYYLWILYLITSGSESRSLLFYSVRKIWQRALAVSPTGLPMILQPTFGRSWIFHAAFCHCSTSWVFHPEFWRSGVLICSYFCWW